MDIVEEIENAQWVGECCGHIARKHSKIRPFPCMVPGCTCTRWDSGE